MRLVVQRVSHAEVETENKVVGKIKNGLLVLIGVARNDKKENAIFLAEKLVKLRVMSDAKGKMNLSLRDVNASVLVVSQFTLYADTQGGNRPSFIRAAEPELAKSLYELFIKRIKDLGVKVQTGCFGSYMQIKACLDGPVTIILEK